MASHERRDPGHPLRRVKDYRPDGTRRRRWSGPERALRLTYRRRPLTVLASTLVAVLLPATIVVAGTRVDTGVRVPEVKRPVAGANLNWSWSDGSAERNRVFNAGEYGGDAARLPTLLFRLAPGDNHLMYWQFLQDGDWNDEWLTKADSQGKATVPLDPLCANGSWCDGQYKYRIKLGDDIVAFDIAYWDR